MAKKQSSERRPFDVGRYLATSGVKKKIVSYRKAQTIFSQGEKSGSVFYLRTGTVKVAVTSSTGKEAVVALLPSRRFLRRGMHCRPTFARFDGDCHRTLIGTAY